MIGAGLIIALSAVVVIASIFYCIQTLQLDPGAMRDRLAISSEHPLAKLDDRSLRWILILGVVLAVMEGIVCGIIGVLCLKQRRSGLIAGIVVSSLRLVIALLGVLLGVLLMIADSMESMGRSNHKGVRLDIIASAITIPILLATIAFLAIALRRARKFPPKLPKARKIV